MSLFISFLHPSSISLLPSPSLFVCRSSINVMRVEPYHHQHVYTWKNGWITDEYCLIPEEWLTTNLLSVFAHVWVDRMFIKKMKNCGFYHLVCHHEHLDVTFCLNENAVVLMKHTSLIWPAMGKHAELFSDNICCSQHVAQLRSSTFVHWWYGLCEGWALQQSKQSSFSGLISSLPLVLSTILRNETFFSLTNH